MLAAVFLYCKIVLSSAFYATMLLLCCALQVDLKSIRHRVLDSKKGFIYFSFT